jgi:acyl carrier protein
MVSLNRCKESHMDTPSRVGVIPRGIEILLCKAAVDSKFKELLLRCPSGAAEAIGLDLEAGEAMMLTAAPAAQLEAVIARTSVPQEHRRAFLGEAAGAMLTALGLMTATCGCGEEKRIHLVGGSRADWDRAEKKKTVEERVTETISGQTNVDAKLIKRTDRLRQYDLIAKERHRQNPSLTALREALEIRFGITIPAEDFEKADSVGDIINYIGRKLVQVAR